MRRQQTDWYVTTGIEKRMWQILFCFVACVFSVNVRARTVSSPLRVACVGNSVTYGYGLADRERTAYPVRLQEMLGEGFEVRNFGHSGATLLSRGHRPYIREPEFRAALDFKPDWVVIHLGLNDTDPRNWPDWKEDFIPDYRALIDSFRTANPQARIAICLMTPIFDRHPRFQSGTRDWHEQIQQAIRSVATGADVQLIDLYTPLHCHPDLFPDALHPNAEGALILAKTVYSALTGRYGGLQLPPLYSKGMVLQRNRLLRLQGTADAGWLVTVTLAGHQLTARAGTDGRWEVSLPPQSAGGPFTMQVTARPVQNLSKPHQRRKTAFEKLGAEEQQITVDSVYFGEVWLASGQSNMELRVDQCDTPSADSADAARLAHRLHLFNMPARARTDAVTWPDSVLAFTNRLQYMDLQGWRKATPDVVSHFSAVAFNFGRVLCDSLPDVPIGIICNAVGGSTTESWIDRTTLEWQLPNILTYWLYGDYGQPWARARMAQNIAYVLQSDSLSYNPLQRHPYEPCYLFEAAIAPLRQYPIQGVLWYQGESNAHNVELHERLFTLLEQSWRTEWQQPDLPFYFVQLSSLGRPSWPAFRDSQRRLAESLPHTWMTVSTDLGDEYDVHYRSKRPVGQRLALQALCHTYGHPLVSEGPSPIGLPQPQPDGTLLLNMANAEGMTVTQGFEIAGIDGLYHPAQATVHGSSIVLHSPHVSRPVSVRYAWQPFTRADLRNRQGLPASTFTLSAGQ